MIHLIYCLIDCRPGVNREKNMKLSFQEPCLLSWLIGLDKNVLNQNPKAWCWFSNEAEAFWWGFFFNLSANGDSESESQSSLGVLGSSEPDCLEKVGFRGQKNPWFSMTAARKSIPGAGEAAQQGLGTALSCSCQSQGMHLAKGKDGEKLSRVQRKAQK